MTFLLVLPILVPFSAAIVGLLAWRSRRVQRMAGMAGATGQFAAGLAVLRTVEAHGIQVVQIGDWPAPFGITLVADLLSAIMLVLAGVIGTAVAGFSLPSIDRGRESFGYYPLFLMLLTGVAGAFLTGDLFNLYVWFEVMLMASFVLMALGGERPQIEGAIKYVTMNLMASALFLAAVGLLYGTAGTLNMADLAVKLADANPNARGMVTAIAMLFLAAFGIKAAVFPFFFWLPASYHTPPVAVSAVFAGLLTKVGVYALIRTFTLVFLVDVPTTHGVILVVSGLTMITGVLGAMAQRDFRRILSFHIVSQIGYMLMGVGLFTPLALAGSIFYLIHHIIVKTTLFLVSGVVARLRGTLELPLLGGLSAERPALAALFLIPALSLAGLPPLSGFFAKLALVRAGLQADSYAIVATALGVSLLTLVSMTKIWQEAFWKPVPDGTPGGAFPTPDEPPGGHDAVAGGSARSVRPLLLPIGALAGLTVAIGLGAEPVFRLAMRAAAQLLEPSQYVTAVLGSLR